MMMLPPNVLKISELSVLEKKELVNPENPFATKDQSSTELSLNSWPKEEISPISTELEENLFMELNSLMKTLKLNTKKLVFCLWLMLDLILMDLNFSLHLFLALG